MCPANEGETICRRWHAGLREHPGGLLAHALVACAHLQA
jgi:hypothetical protein